jgi:hypothetical protein
VEDVGQDSARPRGRRHGKGVMRGIVGRQEVAREMLRRRAAVRRSSGRRRATWRGPGVASARSGKAAVEQEGHMEGTERH